MGVESVVVDGGKFLLVKRTDFEVWGLPGGYVDPGESLAEAAIREAYEETGLKIRLSYLIGLYSFRLWLNRGYHFAAFLARPVSGHLHPQVGEALEVEYFDPDDLPEPLGFGVEQVLGDAVTGRGGFVRSHDGDLGYEYLDLLRQRDGSGLSGRDFYLTVIAPQLEPATLPLDIAGQDT